MGLSVVVPAKARSCYLGNLLESLARARKRTSDPVEVIVVDSSEDESRLTIESLCRRFGAVYHYLHGTVSEARNFGIRAARFQIILFMDSDCEAEPNLLNEHAQFYIDQEIGGCIGLTEFKGKKTWLWDVIEKMPFLQPFQWAEWKEHVSWGPCTNISFRKEILDEVNGFEPVMLPKECGEDVDLGYRVTSSGYKIRCNPNAKAYHTRETWTKLPQFIERAFRFGRGEYHLVEKHPENAFLDFPTDLLILFLLEVLFAYKTLIAGSLLAAMFPLIWLFFKMFVQSLDLEVNTMKRSWRNIPSRFLSLLFGVLFELGFSMECLLKGNLGMLQHRFIYTEEQVSGSRRWKTIRMRSSAISLLVLFTFLMLLGG